MPGAICLALLLHYLLPRLPALEQSLALARRLSWPLLSLAVVAQALSYLANGSLLRVTVAMAGDRLSTGRATAIVMAASTIALIAGGIVGYSAAIHQWTRKSGVGRGASMLAASLPAVFDLSALLIFAFASAFELLRLGRLSPATERALLIVVTVIVMVIASVAFGLYAPQRLIKLLRRLRLTGGRWKRLETTVKSASRSLRNGGAHRAALCAVANLLFDILTLELVFAAAGRHVDVSTLIAGYGVPLLLGRSSFLPGGIAVVEVGMATTYISLGLPSPLVVVAIVIYRLISFWGPTLAGIPVALMLQMQSGARPGRRLR